MSNNGINSASNGRTISANNTSSSTGNNSQTHGATLIKSAVINISTSGGSHVSNKMSINSKANDNRIAKIPNATAATNAATITATASAAAVGMPMSHKSNNNDQYQPHPPHVNPRKLSATPSTNALTANSTSSPSSCSSSATSQATTVPQPLVNVNRLPTHRRDSSNVSGHHNAHGTGGILSQSLKDASKYRYIRPQTVFRKDEPNPNRDEVDRVIAPPVDKRIGHLQEEARKSADNNHDLLVYYNGQLEGGSLEALIEHMVPTYNYYPERIYIFSFLLSARLFVRPHELLAKISQTWERQQQLQQQSGTVASGITLIAHDQLQDDACHFPQTNTSSPLMLRKQSLAGAPSTNIQKSAQNCIRLLAEWIETFPYDFRDERLMQQVRILTRKCVYIDNSLGKQVSKILQLLVQRLTALEKYEEFLQSLQQYDLSNGLQPHYSTSASASYSSSSSSNSSSNQGANNSLTKSSIQALNSHSESSYKNNFLSNAQFHSTTQPATSSTSSNSTSGSGALGSDSPNAHDVFGIMDLCASCAQLAHQLTAIELDRLSHIGPEEFVQAFAKEYQNSISNSSASSGSGGGGSSSGGGGATAGSGTGQMMSTSLNDMKKTRNLESYVEWFNRLSYLTASEIVKYPKKKQRVRVIEYWIETARECFNIGNFNSLMAIIAGLNLAPISRLKKTWAKVQSAKFSVLEHQMDPTSNFNSYRSTLKAAMWRSEGATEERERIIIPFFSLFVKDLYFLNEGCSNRLPNNHINFEKCSQLAKQVMEFNEWKQVSCPFEKFPNVITYLQNIAILSENTLSIASFECEPPENTEEKDRYKTVKAETKQQLLQQLQEQQLQQQQQQQQQQHLHTH